MAYSPEDAQAIQVLAQRMGVPAGSLAGLFELESGGDPNIWGGAGGQYRGLIQFGPGARKEVGLPDRPMTVREQLPFVERYFQQRGFQPGRHGPLEMYRTVLVGNPSQSGTDSFGTNSDKAAARMMPGGDLYERGLKKLGGGGGAAPSGLPLLASGGGADPFAAAMQDILSGPAAPEPARTPEAATALAGMGTSFAASAGLAPPRPPRMASSVPYLQELASSRGGDTSAINSIDQLAMAAVAALNPGGDVAEPRWSSSSGGGALKVGRVADPKEDVFPTTGAHLDVRVVKPDGQYVNPETARSLLQGLVVGGKPLFQQQGGDWVASHPITSRFGPRSAPVAGASTYHRGVDFGVGAHTPLEWRGGGRYEFADGYGVITTPDNYQIKLLHTRPS